MTTAIASTVSQAAAASAAPPSDASVVRATGLRVSYGGAPVLDGVDMTLCRGEMVALLGSSGSGKSTLMKALTGFAPITGGRAVVAGHEVARLNGSRRRRLRADVGQVFQQFNLIPRLSVLQNVLTGSLHHAGLFNLVGGFRTAERRQALALLDRVGLAHKATVSARSLSGGQQQRVAIARALMQRPTVIFADEPVASLDPRLSDSVLSLLHGIAKDEGIPVLVSLHVLSHAMSHSDRVIGLRQGRMVISATTAGLDPDRLAPIYETDQEAADEDD